MRWLYGTLVSDYWAKWLDTKEAKQSFMKGGYYSKMLTSNWKAIVLNSNHAYKSNFWIAYDPVDPDGQLAWLVRFHFLSFKLFPLKHTHQPTGQRARTCRIDRRSCVDSR